MSFRRSKDDNVDTFAVIRKSHSRTSDGTTHFELPNYRDNVDASTSYPCPLTTVRIVEEIHANYHRGRLILFETARRKRSFISLVLGNRNIVELDGPASVLDHALSDMLSDKSLSGDIGDSLWHWYNQAHQSFRAKMQEESSEMYVKHEELILSDSEIKESIGGLFIPRTSLNFKLLTLSTDNSGRKIDSSRVG